MVKAQVIRYVLDEQLVPAAGAAVEMVVKLRHSDGCGLACRRRWGRFIKALISGLRGRNRLLRFHVCLLYLLYQTF